MGITLHHGFPRRRVHFERTAEFLAVCASGDTEEAGEMLKEAKEEQVQDINGGIVNCSNADGITALHQVGIRRICLSQDFQLMFFLPLKYMLGGVCGL